MNSLAVERLPGVLGHELRNPLASAVTGAMLLRELVDADDPRAALVDGVLRDLDRLTNLLDGWLELARAASVSRDGVEIAALLAALATRHGAEVVHCPSSLRVEGHQGLLERALDNLCENARQAGAASIRVAAQTIGDQVALHVEDDGQGIDPADVEHVFAPGWSRRGGSGLGLHAVEVTLAAHGGSVRCVPLARGTRFTLALPLARSAGVRR